MSRRRAAITDAELARVLRVARKHGASVVEVKTESAQFRVVLGDSGENGEKKTAKVAKKPAALI